MSNNKISSVIKVIIVLFFAANFCSSFCGCSSDKRTLMDKKMDSLVAPGAGNFNPNYMYDTINRHYLLKAKLRNGKYSFMDEKVIAAGKFNISSLDSGVFRILYFSSSKSVIGKYNLDPPGYYFYSKDSVSNKGLVDSLDFYVYLPYDTSIKNIKMIYNSMPQDSIDFDYRDSTIVDSRDKLF